MQQNEYALLALSNLVEIENPSRIIEIGTGTGSLSILLALSGINFITYDINDQRQSKFLFRMLGIDFREVNIFEKVDEVKDLIQLPGKTLLIVDGGNKPKEFKIFSPFLKENDIIIAHDYQYDSTTWSWSEVDDSVLDESLQKIRVEEMGKAAWLCCKKLGNNQVAINDGKKVERPIRVFASICTIRNPDVQQMASIQGTWFSQNQDVRTVIGYEFGDALVDRARSTVASQFLDETNGDMLLFIDDDILFDPDDVVRIAKKAKKLGTIVCGAYRIKSISETRLAINPLGPTEIPIGKEIGKDIEVKYASTGFMCIPREVLEAIAKTLPKVDSARGIDEKTGKKKLEFWPFFQPIYPEGEYLSEDYALCFRARELGYKIYLDSSIVLGHIGKVVFWPGEIKTILE